MPEPITIDGFQFKSPEIAALAGGVSLEQDTENIANSIKNPAVRALAGLDVSEGEKKLYAARERHKDEPIGVIQSFKRSYMPYGDLFHSDVGGTDTAAGRWIGRTVGTKEYAEAVKRVREGHVSDADAETIALYERHQQIDAEVRKGANVAQRLGLELGGLGKIGGEAVFGGAVVGGAASKVGQGLRYAGVVKPPPVAVANAAGATAPIAPAVEAGLLRQGASYAASRVVPTAVTPAMYVQHAQQKNIEEGRAANALEGYGPAAVYAYANMLVLGRLQGGVQGNLAAQSAKKGLLGTVELTGVDAIAEAADKFLPKGARTGARSNVSKWFDAYLKGDKEGASEALRDTALQVAAFGLFAAAHGKTPDAPKPEGIYKSYADAADKLVAGGASKEGAAAQLQEVHKKLQAGMRADPYLTREQAWDLFKDTEGPAKRYASELVRAFEPAEKPKPIELPPGWTVSGADASTVKPSPAQAQSTAPAPQLPSASKLAPKRSPVASDATKEPGPAPPAPKVRSTRPGSVDARLTELEEAYKAEREQIYKERDERLRSSDPEISSGAAEWARGKRKRLNKKYIELDDLRAASQSGQGNEDAPVTKNVKDAIAKLGGSAPEPKAKGQKPATSSSKEIDPADPLASLSDAGQRAFVQKTIESKTSLAEAFRDYPDPTDRFHQIARAYARKFFAEQKAPEQKPASDATKAPAVSEFPTPPEIAPEAPPSPSEPAPVVEPVKAQENATAVAKQETGEATAADRDAILAERFGVKPEELSDDAKSSDFVPPGERFHIADYKKVGKGSVETAVDMLERRTPDSGYLETWQERDKFLANAAHETASFVIDTRDFVGRVKGRDGVDNLKYAQFPLAVDPALKAVIFRGEPTGPKYEKLKSAVDAANERRAEQGTEPLRLETVGRSGGKAYAGPERRVASDATPPEPTKAAAAPERTFKYEKPHERLAEAALEHTKDPGAREIIESALENGTKDTLDLMRTVGGFIEPREGGNKFAESRATVDSVTTFLEDMGAQSHGPVEGDTTEFSNRLHAPVPIGPDGTNTGPGDRVRVVRRPMVFNENTVSKGVVERPKLAAPPPKEPPKKTPRPLGGAAPEKPTLPADVAAVLDRVAGKSVVPDLTLADINLVAGTIRDADPATATFIARKFNPSARGDPAKLADNIGQRLYDKIPKREQKPVASDATTEKPPETPEQEAERLKQIWELASYDSQKQIEGVKNRLKELGVKVEFKSARYNEDRTQQATEGDRGALELIERSEELQPPEKIALDLYMRGASAVQIGKRLNVSHTEAGKIIREAFKALRDESGGKITDANALEWRERLAEEAKLRAEADESRPAEDAADLARDESFEKSGDGLFNGESGFVDLNVVENFIKKNFTAAGALPKSAFASKLASDASVRAHARRAKDAERDLRSAVKKAFGVSYDKIRDADRERLNRVLAGEEAPPDPQSSGGRELGAAIENMRHHIDVLSDALVASGAIDARLVPTVLANKGTYLTRQYRAFSDPEWASKVHEDVKNRYKVWLRDEMLDAISKAKGNKKKARLAKELAETDFDAEVQRVLTDGKASENPIAFIAKSRLGSKDLSVLRERKGLPVELRELLGEIKDPIANYVNAIAKQSHLIANHVFLSQAREAGLREGWLSERSDGANVTPIADEGSKVMGPLAGLHTTPEIKAAFAEGFSDKSRNAAVATAMTLIASAKYAKTVLSPVAHARNFFSGPLAVMRNGHFNILKGVGVAKRMWSDTPEAREYRYRLAELGVTEEGIAAGELRQVRDDVLGRQSEASDLAGLPASDANLQRAEATLKRAVKLTGRAAERVYHAQDAFWKILAFEGEVKRYERAHPEWSKEQVEQKAAEIVRNTMPTYSMVSRAVKSMRFNPFNAPFASFPAEVIRNTYHTVKLAFTEMRDPATRAIGAQRLAGMMASATASAVAASVSRYLTGTSAADEDEMRKHLPEYEKNSRLLHLGRDKDGKRRYIDLSRTDPNSYLTDAITAAWRGKNPEESAKFAAQAVAKPFTDEEILTKALIEAKTGDKAEGGRVFNPAASDTDKWLARAEHVAKAFEPGIYTQARRIKMGLAGQSEQKTGRTYDPLAEAVATVTGQRVEAQDLDASITRKSRAFNAGKTDATKMLSDMVRAKGDVSEADMRLARFKQEEARKRAFTEFREAVLSAERLGMERGKIAKLMRDAEVSEEDRKMIFSGVYRPLVPEVKGGLQERQRLGQVRQGIAPPEGITGPLGNRLK